MKDFKSLAVVSFRQVSDVGEKPYGSGLLNYLLKLLGTPI